ncbi:LysM peptidoglycan-binding domain-containing protein [Bernardetia sp. ABR2-2B]|uniref:LysM peptidoglycan-binding domain-containing protein n=1 Tax=Bernardetia sp. ABR2-2B TaxID=3127472 RepID=UPI0030CCD91A
MATYHTVQSGDTLWGISRQYQISVDEIRRLNNMSDASLSLGQRLQVSQSTPTYGGGNTAVASSPTTSFYTVQAGDSLWRIATKLNLSVNEIKALNNLTSNALSLGQQLRISGGGSDATSASISNSTPTIQTNSPTVVKAPVFTPRPSYVVQAGDSMWRVSQKVGVSVNEIKSINNLTSNILRIGQMLYLEEKPEVASQAAPVQNPQPTQAAPKIIYHTVVSGDSLYRIAMAYNVGVQDIKESNGLSSNALSLGQRLMITKKAKTTSYSSSSSSNSSVSTNMGSGASKGNSSSSVSETGNISKYEQNKKEVINLDAINGVQIFGSGGLSASVGRGGANRQVDVEKVQQRFVQLDYMNAVGGLSQIQATISAIDNFQRRNKIDWWAGKSSLIGASGYSNGLIKPNDVTYKLLREHTTYNITYKDHRGNLEKVRFSNFVRSNYSVYPYGISYSGTVIHDIPASYYESVGLSRQLAEALEFVSKNEGKFDAINSYDKAAFSFGFIQFAGQTGGGTFPHMMALIKDRNPSLFEEAFGRFGLDVEYTYRNDKYNAAKMVVFTPNGKRYEGTDAEKYIRSDKVLHGVFIRAGQNVEVAKLQVLAAVQEYVKPALRAKISLNANGVDVNREPVTDFINSAGGITVLIDLAVNQGLTGALRIFAPAMEQVMKQTGIRSVAALKNIDEKRVIQTIVANATDARVRTRPQKVLDAGISFS